MKNTFLKIFLFLIVLIAVVITTIFLFSKKRNDFTFEIDSENKYKITTDTRWYTMQNDGGSNTNVYYCFDLDNNIITKVSDSYKANLGGTPENTVTVVFEKTITSELKTTLQDFIEEILIKEDINDTKNYLFFTINSLDSEKQIYNQNTISEIKEILNQIDTL